MKKASFGKFGLSDRLAIGRFKSISKYCEIGKGKNFVNLETTDFWKHEVRQSYLASGGSHETHLGAWLMLNGIEFLRRDYLDY